MAFCVNCGSNVAEGAKFCLKCGAAVEAVQPVQPQVQPQAVYQQPVQQPAQSAPPQSTPLNGVKKSGNTLFRIAAIVAPVIWLAFTIAVILINFVLISREQIKMEMARFGINADDATIEMILHERRTIRLDSEEIIVPIVFLAILAIPTILNILGARKGNRAMILIAGVLYIFSVFGIPSAILCFIGYGKLKKEAQVG